MTDLPTPPIGVVALGRDLPLAVPNRAARFAASALILLTTVVAGLVVWQSWRSYWLVRDVLTGVPSVTREQVEEAERIGTWLAWAWLGGLAVSLAAFAVWLWRARVNAGRISDAPHRHRIRWAAVAWVVPLVNLWWPQEVVADVHKASRPATPARGADLAKLKPSPLVGMWWGALLAAQAVDLVSVFLIADEPTEESFFTLVVSNGVSAGLALVAAVAALVFMRRIDRWQAGRVLIR